jgi:hypothetical protein
VLLIVNWLCSWGFLSAPLLELCLEPACLFISVVLLGSSACSSSGACSLLRVCGICVTIIVCSFLLRMFPGRCLLTWTAISACSDRVEKLACIGGSDEASGSQGGSVRIAVTCHRSSYSWRPICVEVEVGRVASSVSRRYIRACLFGRTL